MHSRQQNEDRYAGPQDCELGQPKQRESYRRGKECRQILGPALAHLGKATVHASADGVAAVAEEDPAFRLLDRPGKRDILQQLTGDSGMPSDGVISLSGDEQILTVSRRDWRGRITNISGPVRVCQLGENDR